MAVAYELISNFTVRELYVSPSSIFINIIILKLKLEIKSIKQNFFY